MASIFDLFSSPDSSGQDTGGMSYMDLANSLAGLYGGYQGYQNAGNVNNQVQGALGQNLGTTSTSIQQLQQQIAQQRAEAQAAYEAARGNVGTQNTGLEGDIGTMTSNLNALSDPNSPYMQQARQAIERKDAAAGRRSQWGERETQLAGTLADYVGKYSPGMQSAITNARNQINANNLGLANMYSTMNNPADRNQQALAQMLQQQQAGATAANTTGRAAANSATNNMTGMIQNGIKGVGGLMGLFGGTGGGTGWDGMGMMGNLFSSPDSSGWGDGGLWGNSFAPMSDYGVDTSGLGGYGYGNLPAGDYFGGGGIGGVPTAWDGGFGGGGLNDDSIWDF